jgi:hypothetical protein
MVLLLGFQFMRIQKYLNFAMAPLAKINVTTISVGFGLYKDAIICCLFCYKLVRK